MKIPLITHPLLWGWEERRSPPVKQIAQESLQLEKLKEYYSTIITFSNDESTKLEAVVDALRNKHEAAIPRSVRVDLLAKAKLILKEESRSKSTCTIPSSGGTATMLKRGMHTSIFIPESSADTTREEISSSVLTGSSIAGPSNIASDSKGDKLPSVLRVSDDFVSKERPVFTEFQL